MKNKKYIIILIVFIAIVSFIIAMFAGKGDQEVNPEIIPNPSISTQPTVETGPTEYQFKTQKAYEEMIHKLGYVEFVADNQRLHSDALYPCQFHKIIVNNNDFVLTFAYDTLKAETEELSMFDGWSLYGTKSDNIQIIDTIPIEEDALFDEKNYYEFYDVEDTGYREVKLFYIYDSTSSEKKVSILYAVYYPQTGNLYNFIRLFDMNKSEEWNIIMPNVLWEDSDNEAMYDMKNAVVQLVDGEPVEVAEFTIQFGNETKTYQYRTGMTLGLWASSSLAQGDWLVGIRNVVYSSDFQYALPASYIDIRYLLDDNHTIIASLLDEEEKLYAEETQMGLSQIVTPFSFVHLVNWDTPLLSPGIQIISQYSNEGYWLTNHSSVYSLNDQITLSLYNVDQSILSDIKVYSFKEPAAIIDIIQQGNGFLDHLSPIDEKNLSIPEDAKAISFTRVDNDFIEYTDPESQETVSELRYENIVSATWQVNQEQNFEQTNLNVFAVTYQDEVIYWIHIPVYSDTTYMFDFSKINIILNQDGSFYLESDVYTEEELLVAKEILEQEENWYEGLMQDASDHLH